MSVNPQYNIHLHHLHYPYQTCMKHLVVELKVWFQCLESPALVWLGDLHLKGSG